MKKIRVGVLMGGRSIEREVSFNSGRTVCDHLDISCYDIIPIFQSISGQLYLLPWRFLHRGKIADFEQKLKSDASSLSWDALKSLVDFVYICTHGQYAEDGVLQGTLTLLQIPYLGSKIYASAICMDKIVQKDVMRMHNIAVPKDIIVSPAMINTWNTEQIVSALEQQSIAFPCVVKPYKEGSSLGVTVVKKISDLYTAVQNASWVNGCKQQSVLIEEKINGMEFSCITLMDYKNNCLMPLPPTEIVPETGTDFFDYEQKYMPGRAHKYTPARVLPDLLLRIQETCTKVMQALDMCTISRIDGFVSTDNRIVIVDPNTLSGMAPSSFLFREAAEIGMSHTDVINHLIATELYENKLFSSFFMHNKQKTKGSRMIRKRIAVLFGGRSNEKEISLESGRNILYKLSPETYEAIPLFLNTDLNIYHISQSLLVRNTTIEIASHVTEDMRVSWDDLSSIADFIFIGLHGGEGENGTIQGMIEMLGLPYNGSAVLTSSLCMNKYNTNQLLASKGFVVPDSCLIEKQSWAEKREEYIAYIEETIAYPLIIKPHDDGCSVMVQKAQTQEQLIQAITLLFDNNKEYALVESCITGIELTVGVIGNETIQVLPPSRAVITADILSMCKTL